MIEHLVAKEREVLVEKIHALSCTLGKEIEHVVDLIEEKTDANNRCSDRDVAFNELQTKFATAIGVLENLLGATNLKSRTAATKCANQFVSHNKPAE